MAGNTDEESRAWSHFARAGGKRLSANVRKRFNIVTAQRSRIRSVSNMSAGETVYCRVTGGALDHS